MSLVSVIIPCYNSEDYILETVNSVLSQEHKNLECIIVDDGSTDKSVSILESSISDDRMRIISQTNAGVSAARNNGFAESKGHYLAFLDSDDVWLPLRIGEMLDYFSQDSELGLVHTYMQVIDGDSKPQDEILKGKEGFILDSLLLWDGCNIPAPSSILVKRIVVDEVGGFDTDLQTAADQEFFFRVANKYKIGMVKKVLGYYRVHDNNMHSNVKHMEEDHLRTYKKASALSLFKNRLFERKCYSNLYMILAGSWWKNGQNKLRGMYYMLKAVMTYPSSIKKVASKLIG